MLDSNLKRLTGSRLYVVAHVNARKIATIITAVSASDVYTITRCDRETTAKTSQIVNTLDDSIPVGRSPALSSNWDAEQLFDKLVLKPKREVENRGAESLPGQV